MKCTSVAKALATAALVSFAVPSYAALVDCPAGFTTNPTAKVENAAGTDTAASGCQYIVPADQSNVGSIANINTAGFFGTTTWLTNNQDQMQGSGSIGSSGTWSVANVNFTLYDYILVFKDGAGTNLVAFLLNESYSSGVWSTPFTNPPFAISGSGKDNSHLTIARRLTGQQVSEPGILGLLGISLVMLGLLRRRKTA